jgi:hypothetical protein
MARGTSSVVHAATKPHSIDADARRAKRAQRKRAGVEGGGQWGDMTGNLNSFCSNVKATPLA